MLQTLTEKAKAFLPPHAHFLLLLLLCVHNMSTIARIVTYISRQRGGESGHTGGMNKNLHYQKIIK